MSLTWSDEEKTLLESVRPVLSTREIHKMFGILGYNRSMNAIQNMGKKLGITFKDFGAPAVHGLNSKEKNAIKQVLMEREEYISAVEVPTIDAPSAKANKTRERKEIMVDFLEELKEIRRSTPRYGSISQKKAPNNSEKQSLVLLMSDWHVGQTVVDTQHNEVVYNTDIAINRICSIPEKVLASLTSDQLSNIDECVILLGGDIITGEGIYKHQEITLEYHAAEQVLKATKATWKMIQEFRGIFPLVRIITTKGNHGRSGASPEANWDNMIYQQLELLVDMDGKDNITIKNRYGDFNAVNIKGWKGLLRHHAPVQADTAAGIAKFASWHGIHEWDFFCFGHWHHWGVMTWNGKPIYRNGALAGGDDYAETLAKYDHPVQLIFGISEEEVCTFVNPIRFY